MSGFSTNGLLYPLTKGDVAGHEFHGNQWVPSVHGDGNEWLQQRLTGSVWNIERNGKSQGVTAKQAEALRSYYQYQKEINNGNDKPTARLIMNAIEKNTTNKTITTFRGVSWEDGQQLRRTVEGRPFIKQGFFSSSISPNVAKRFSDADILMKITIPEGSHAIGILGNEGEVLLPVGAEFSVDKISEVQLIDGTKFPVAECTYKGYWKKGEGIVKSLGFTTNELLYPITKGDLLGHPFRGNQYEQGESFGVVSAEEFSKVFDKAFLKNNPYSAFVNHYSVSQIQEGKMVPMLSRDGKTGLLVHDHGDGRVEATALFSISNKAGAGLRLLKDAIDKQGVNYVECFGEFLPKAYETVGFKTESKSPFDPQYAPDDWDYKKFGTPNYYTMRLEK